MIQEIKFNEYNQYQVIFDAKIKQIDTNWHEKVYTAFAKYPLVCDSEKINIYTNIHEPSKIEKQLNQLYSGMIGLCGSRKKENNNPFEETLEMKVKKFSRLTTQIIGGTKYFAQHLQHVKTMKIVNVKQGGKNEYDFSSARNISKTNIQNVEDAISQCHVMISQLKQNMAKADDQNKNVFENVSLEELENECERIEKTIQEKYNQTNKTICETVLKNIDFIEKQAQEMIEYDWKEYNIQIFKQWELQMEQLKIVTETLVKIPNVVNGGLNYETKFGMQLQIVYTDGVGLVLFAKSGKNDDSETNVKLNGISKKTNENLTTNESLLIEKLFCNITYDDDGNFLCDIGNEYHYNCNDFPIRNENIYISINEYTNTVSKLAKFKFFIIDDGV